MIYTEFKKRVSSFFIDEVKNLWNEWELRLMVLCSLFLQFFLFKCGNRQGHFTNQRMRIILVWSAYMSADWFATVSLKNLLDLKEDTKLELMACWAPFLVFHLGGPDTITAYDIQDNELWKRHLFGLFIQLFTALGIIGWSLRTSTAVRVLIFVTIPILVAGIIRNIERICALWSASQVKIRRSLLEASSKKSGGSPKGKNAELNPQPSHADSSHAQWSDEVKELVTQLPYKVIYDDAIYLHEAYLLYKLFKNLFAGLTLTFYREALSVLTIDTKSAKQAFKLVDVELEFLYDALHTKAIIIHSRAGIISRFFCFLCSICSSVAFSVIIARYPNHDYSKIDLGLTILLMAGAISLDILGLHRHINSSRMLLWLTMGPSKSPKNVSGKHNKFGRMMLWLTKGASNLAKIVLAKIVHQTISTKLHKGKPDSMAQYSLIDYCLDAKTFIGIEVLRFFDPYDALLKHGYMAKIDVDDELKEFIFLHLKDKYMEYGFKNFNSDHVGELLDMRGVVFVELFSNIYGTNYEAEYANDDHEFLRSVVEGIEFDKNLLVWHIATDLNYYVDEVIPSEDIFMKCKVSKCLSDYMFYLLSIRPHMLPKGIGEIRIRDTLKQFGQFFPRDKSSVDRKELCNAVLEMGDQFGTINPEGQPIESSLSDAIRLYNLFQSLGENKWEMISKMWVEMLTYAASECEWNQHAGHLKRGNELLTQVSLLMAHFLLSKQIRLVPIQDLGDVQHDVEKLYDWDRLYYLA